MPLRFPPMDCRLLPCDTVRSCSCICSESDTHTSSIFLINEYRTNCKMMNVHLRHLLSNRETLDRCGLDLPGLTADGASRRGRCCRHPPPCVDRFSTLSSRVFVSDLPPRPSDVVTGRGRVQAVDLHWGLEHGWHAEKSHTIRFFCVC